MQDVFNFLISPKILKALEANNLTGWKTYEVETDIELIGYEGFQCTSYCGPPIHPKKKGFVTGYDFDLKTWDGSDFFIPDTTMMTICSRKAKEVLESLEIRNLELVNLRTLKWYNL